MRERTAGMTLCTMCTDTLKHVLLRVESLRNIFHPPNRSSWFHKRCPRAAFNFYNLRDLKLKLTPLCLIHQRVMTLQSPMCQGVATTRYPTYYGYSPLWKAKILSDVLNTGESRIFGSLSTWGVMTLRSPLNWGVMVISLLFKKCSLKLCFSNRSRWVLKQRKFYTDTKYEDKTEKSAQIRSYLKKNKQNSSL